MIVKLYKDNNDPKVIQQIVDVFNDGGLVIYPTDTMYAIGCHALRERAVEQICRIKGIDPTKNSLSIICYDLSNVSEYAKISNSVYKMIRRNVPGPFTFILPGLNKLPKVFHNRKGKEVGIRMPDEPILREIAYMLDAPIMTSTLPISDNMESEYLTNPELINEAFGDLVDLVIDGGIGTLDQSTVVDCTTDEPEIVRQGKGELK